jgi:hypothetical protein
MRPLILAAALAMAQVPAAHAQVSFGIGVQMPGVSLGIAVPSYPELVLVPGLPVYHAPRLPLNYFYFDGLFWVFRGDDWYTSSWYDGPWHRVWPYDVPDFILRVPVRYYVRPPAYFNGWRREAPPRWTDRWGRDWSQRRAGWDRWDRRVMPPAAPLPDYQRSYGRDRYPHDEGRQRAIRQDHFRFQPNEPVGRHQYDPPVERHRRPVAAGPVRQAPSHVERKPVPLRQAGPPPDRRGADKPAASQQRGERPSRPTRSNDQRGQRQDRDR